MEADRSPSAHFASPTDDQLVHDYLLPKVQTGINNGTSFIHDADVYSAHPEELSTKYAPAVSLDGRRAWYFFTSLISKGNKGRRIARAVPNGCGSWTAERKAKPVYTGIKKQEKKKRKKIAERKSLSFTIKDEGGSKVRSGWLMTEFVAVDNNGKQGDLALCKVYRTPRNSENSGSEPDEDHDKEASDAAEEEEEEEEEADGGRESTGESDEDHDKEDKDAAAAAEEEADGDDDKEASDVAEEEEEEADGGGESTGESDEDHDKEVNDAAASAAIEDFHFIYHALSLEKEEIHGDDGGAVQWRHGFDFFRDDGSRRVEPCCQRCRKDVFSLCAWCGKIVFHTHTQPPVTLVPANCSPASFSVPVGPGPEGSSAGADECLADSNTDTAAGKTAPAPVPSESETAPAAPISVTPEKAISTSPPIDPEGGGYMCTQNDLEVIESFKKIPSSPGSQEIVLIDGYAVTRSNMECLFQPGKNVNAQVIDARIAMLRTQEHRSGCSAFLEDSDFSNAVKRGLISKKTIEERVLSYLRHDMVFLPINIPSETSPHWYLAVLNAKKRQIQVLDSLSTAFGRDDLRKTMSKLKEGIDLVRREIKENKWPDIDVDSWPEKEIFQEKMQTDGYSCGLFLLKYVEHWTGEKLRHGVTQEDMTLFRKKLAAILLTSELNSRKGSSSVENDNTGSTSDVEIVEANQTLKKRKHRGLETETPEDESVLSKPTQGVKYRRSSSTIDRGSSPSRDRTESDTRAGAAPADPTIGIKPRRSNPDSFMKSPKLCLEPLAAEVAEASESELPAATALAFDSSIPPGGMGMVEDMEMATCEDVHKIVKQMAESSFNYGVLMTSLAAERDRYAAELKTECEEHKRTKAALEAANREKEEAITAVRAECEQDKEAIRKHYRQKMEECIQQTSASVAHILRARYDID